MYFTKPAAKPWRISRNYACFVPNKMRSERHYWRFHRYGRHAEASEVYRNLGNDPICIREQRRQQRRLNRWLADPNCPEWDE